MPRHQVEYNNHVKGKSYVETGIREDETDPDEQEQAGYEIVANALSEGSKGRGYIADLEEMQRRPNRGAAVAPLFKRLRDRKRGK